MPSNRTVNAKHAVADSSMAATTPDCTPQSQHIAGNGESMEFYD